MNDADRLRAQKRASTDPERLERMAQEEERRMTQDDEREARAIAWLKKAYVPDSSAVFGPGIEADENRATILAKLDEPRLPRPEDVPDEVLLDAYEKGCGAGHPVLSARAVYQHIRKHYTKPAEPVVAWAVVWPGSIRFFESAQEALDHRSPGGVIKKLVEDRDGK